VLQLREGLEPGEVVMVFQGTIPNQKGVPVVQEWVAVRFAGTGLNVVEVEPFEAVAERLELVRRPCANSNDVIPDHLRKPLPYVAEQRPTTMEMRRLAQQKVIDMRLDDHECFVNEGMTIEPAPYLKVAAVLHRDSS
jgi:hypothetical protein